MDNPVVKPEPYIPDFSMKPTTDIVYLKLSRGYYIASRRATFLGRSKHSEHTEDEVFHKECINAKLLTNINSISDTAQLKNDRLTVISERESGDKESDDPQSVKLQDEGDASRQGQKADVVSFTNVTVEVETNTDNMNPGMKDNENVPADPTSAVSRDKNKNKSDTDENIPLMERTDLHVHLSDLPV